MKRDLRDIHRARWLDKLQEHKDMVEGAPCHVSCTIPPDVVARALSNVSVTYIHAVRVGPWPEQVDLHLRLAPKN